MDYFTFSRARPSVRFENNTLKSPKKWMIVPNRILRILSRISGEGSKKVVLEMSFMVSTYELAACGCFTKTPPVLYYFTRR
jgi:hypothetical protein